MKLKIAILSTLITMSLSALTIGELPKDVTISGDDGGLVVDGSEWKSSSIKDNLFVMFYVDPDEKDVNEHYSQALKAKKETSHLHFKSIAVINLAATWKPNFIIESILKSKQEEYPHTLYVKDKNSVLVKEWDIADDSSNIIIFSKEGKILFYKAGAMSEEDIEKSFQIIEDNS